MDVARYKQVVEAAACEERGRELDRIVQAQGDERRRAERGMEGREKPGSLTPPHTNPAAFKFISAVCRYARVCSVLHLFL